MAEKELKPIDPQDVSDTIQDIVALLGAIESSREEINRRVKHLKDTYGLASTAVRAAANVIYKETIEQLGEKEQQIRNIIKICDEN
jgi:predicted transcriptional regulator